MAISRMQQPRQNYGLGSFVKKLTRKVTRPFTKVARKLVPKEIAGIMRVAAPFVPGPAGTLMYLAGTAKQRGGISPVDLALAAAPYAAQTNFGKGITEKIGNINVPFTTNEFEPNRAKTLREFLVGDTSKYKTKITPGLFGEGDRMFKIGSGMSPLDTKAGQFLFGTPLKDNKGNIIPGKFKPSYTKIGAQALAVGDFINTQKQLEKLNEGASDVVEETAGGGVTDSEAYQNFLERLALLTPEAFRVPEGLRLPAKSGGLMRTNFSIGGRDEDPKPLPSDPTEPVNPFRPKPIGPFPSKKASVDDPFYRDSEGDRDEHSFRMFNKPYKELNQNELEEFQEEMQRLMNKFSKSKSEGIMMAGLDRKEKAQMLADELAEEQFGMDFYDLDIRTQMKIYQIALDMIDEGGNAMGGLPNNRMNFALGTKPTAQESGLGGLPIEADMRYTGGFMPYGAKEKADDVPARLSKNEFVFTADAVRAAGGGSVNEGARKMYQAMKQLEAKPEAKGMMA